MTVETFTKVPTPPSWMTCKYAIEEWNTLAPELMEAGMLPVRAIILFEMLCAVTGGIIDALASGKDVDPELFAVWRDLRADFGLRACRTAYTRSVEHVG